MSTRIQQGQVDRAELVARIRHEFPDLRFAGASLNDTGEDHAVVLLDECCVFRFPRTAEATARGATERRLLAALNAAATVATPKYSYVSRAGDFGGYRMIAGRELTEAIFVPLSRAAQERVLGEIGDFLRVLHALPADLVARRAGGESTQDAAWFVDRHAERRGRLAKTLGSTLLDAADRFYRALPSAVATSRVAVIHGDFTEDHILLDPTEGRLAGVIDFTDAGLGDPAFDFTCLWAYGRWAPEQAAQSYSAGADVSDILSRSLWWFARYRVDQIWWSVSGARNYDVVAIGRELEGLFDTLGL
jgi:aminoglycoside 2''-phosphotransferase